MALDKKLFKKEEEAAAPSGGGTGNQEEGLILHLDANDDDSYDGDGSVWYDIANHEYTPATNVDEHFNTLLYTGDDGNDRAITGVGFQPDLVWIKNRDSATSHMIYDSVRGAEGSGGDHLSSDTTGLAGGGVTSLFDSFDTDGFTIDKASSSRVNETGDKYVAWCFKAGGAAVSNTDGDNAGSTLTSSVSVNTDLGFSIVKWTDVNVNTRTYTVGHGLEVPPEMIITKEINDTGNWVVYAKGFTNDEYIMLNSTNAKASLTDVWGTALPTATVFGQKSSTSVSLGKDVIAYCFASKRGVSKVGSYEGTGSANNKVYTGFEPAFVMFKNTSATGNWIMHDNKRDTTNPRAPHLRANTSGAEDTGSSEQVDFNTDGFTLNGTGQNANTSGHTFIYLAFAKNTKETQLTPEKGDFTAEDTVTTGAELEFDANDYSGTGNWLNTGDASSSDGTITGASYVNDGTSDYFSFDGNDYITSSSSGLTANTYTIEAWFYMDSLQTAGIVSWGDQGSNYERRAMITWNGGGSTYYLYSSTYASNIRGNTALEAGRWYHGVITMDNGEANIYLNGEHDGSGTNTLSAYTSSTLYIGRTAEASEIFGGDIAIARVYDTVLTSAQIKANYDATYGLYQHADLELHLDAGDTDSYDPSSDGSTWSDISGNSRNATLTSMTATNHDKEIGGWFDVVKTSDYVTIPYNAALVPTSTGYTFEGWYNFDEQVGGSHWSSVFGNWDTSGNADGMLLRFKGANVEFFVYENGSSVFSSTGTASGVSTNEWFHIVMTMTTNASGGAVKVYINGEQKISGTLSGAYNPNSTQDLFMCYGGDIDAQAERYFDGKVGQGRIYSTALTESQIRQNYNFTKNDYPNGYNGTISGASFLPSAVSFDFDGSDDYVSLDSSFRTAFDKPYRSMTIWVKWDGKSTGYGMPFYMTGAGLTNGRFACQLTHSNGELTVFVGADGSYPSTTLSSDTWYHIAIVQSGTSYEAFVDNTSIGTATNDNYTATGTATSYIGSWKNSNYYWSGEISDVKFFDKALTSTELTADYNKGYNGAN